VDYVTAEHPGLPLSVLGHSMGGLVTARLACLGCDPVESYVLSGPLIAMAGDVSRLKVMASRLLRRVIPRFQLDAGVGAEWLSHDEQIVRAYRDDPLVHAQMSISLGAGIMDTQERVLADASQVAVPILLLHGSDDHVCAPEGSEEFHRRLRADVARMSEIELLPGLYHEILNEIGREEIFEKVLSWLRRPHVAQQR
jgi:alpha-beta hydrolase superfamily lysophospholipase